MVVMIFWLLKILAENVVLILANIIVFAWQWLSGTNQEALVYQYAMDPGNLTSGLDLGDVAEIFTSIFMHATY